MQCPKCQAALRERERETSNGQVVVMDVCPSCGGVWLDKGELEQLTASESRYNSERGRGAAADDDDDEGRGGKRRGGFLGNLFDFGD